MAGLNFERNLPHQTDATNAILGVFNGVGYSTVNRNTSTTNPVITIEENLYSNNITNIQTTNHIFGNQYRIRSQSKVLDIQMETGTGKTYTYTKTIFELNKQLGLFKFIIIVPTLSIKAGTVNFLEADATIEHFRQDYDRNLIVYVVESQKINKKKQLPSSIVSFVSAGNVNPRDIHVMVINAGMINSPIMEDSVLRELYSGDFDNLFMAIQSCKPITIIDEPHKFRSENRTWQNIEKFKSQYIIRYGATFNQEYHNLVYQLTAIKAFNQALVKDIVAHVESFESGQDAIVKLKSSNGIEAEFELIKTGTNILHKLGRGDSLHNIHPEMHDLIIDNLNRSKVVLSNGLELKVGDKINPYSYSESLQDKMIQQALKQHFTLEKDLLTRQTRIKPLTLFFIDDITSYRQGNNGIGGELKAKFETWIEAHIKLLLTTETHEGYKEYLTKSLADISLCHGGYFSRDNSDADERIEIEINEILHNKEALLQVDNPRRFIFSKWTLREGWDNPNVFQICKLRTSGSETSKLQEVGRGLRLPVNEHMNRVKDESFDLHYYVDFTEKDFVDKLVRDINISSNVAPTPPTKITDEMIDHICSYYQDTIPKLTKELLLARLDTHKVINRLNDFTENGYSILTQRLYPKAFVDNILKSGKIRKDNQVKKVALRKGKYYELKALWETINQKVILEYKIDKESTFKQLLINYFKANANYFKPQGAITTHYQIQINPNNEAIAVGTSTIDEQIYPLVTMQYQEFIHQLAKVLAVNIITLHNCLHNLKRENILDIRQYMSQATINTIRKSFKDYLLDSSFTKYQIGYHKISNQIHPTIFTDSNGMPLKEVRASSIGTHQTHQETSFTQINYLFEEASYYDSQLELENIQNSNISEVVVFTKIPKNSIRIPVAGGGTYSPDFAYIVKSTDGKSQLNLIVETKDREIRDLNTDEKQKIKHAEALFSNNEHNIKITFKTQLAGTTIQALIRENIQ